ncbi:hypothetical protein [Kordiimonas sp.]|uniref:hypothetical protein n=1 Tax=Kordiimonas sp. TaxID=1970157 RepID=UPI003A95305D
MRTQAIGILTVLLLAGGGAGAQEAACDGNACDLLSPAPQASADFQKYQMREQSPGWALALGTLSGALIGNEIADTAGAVGGAALGAALSQQREERWRVEERAKERDEAQRRGDDMFYNPAHRIPVDAHYLHTAGPRRKVK